MTFIEAMKLCKQGIPVHRLGWQSKSFVCCAYEVKHHSKVGHTDFPMWHNHKRGEYERVNIYIPYYEDVFAEDWATVEKEALG